MPRPRLAVLEPDVPADDGGVGQLRGGVTNYGAADAALAIDRGWHLLGGEVHQLHEDAGGLAAADRADDPVGKEGMRLEVADERLDRPSGVVLNCRHGLVLSQRNFCTACHRSWPYHSAHAGSLSAYCMNRWWAVPWSFIACALHFGQMSSMSMRRRRAHHQRWMKLPLDIGVIVVERGGARGRLEPRNAPVEDDQVLLHGVALLPKQQLIEGRQVVERGRRSKGLEFMKPDGKLGAFEMHPFLIVSVIDHGVKKT